MRIRRKLKPVIILLTVILCSSAVTAIALDTSTAVQYLKSNQAQDGGFSEPGEASNIRSTCWAILGILAVGEDPKALVNNGIGPVEYLNAKAGGISEIEDYELILLAYTAEGGDPHNVAGLDMVSIVKSFEGKDGKIGDSVSQHCMGVLSLLSAGEEASSKWGEWIVQNQRSDGGWGEADAIIETALAVETLVALDEGSNEIIKPAMKYLRDNLNGDGGFSGKSGGSDSQTTSFVIRAINAVGDDPASESWSFQGNNPLSFMNSTQKSDGHFLFSVEVDSEPTLTTGLALLGIAGKYFPLGKDRAGARVQKTGDLGTMGAGIQASVNGQADWIDESTEKDGGTEVSADSSLGRVRAGFVGDKKSQLNNLWFLTITIIAYLLILLVAGIVIRITFQS